jgi:hypothetical protein
LNFPSAFKHPALDAMVETPKDEDRGEPLTIETQDADQHFQEDTGKTAMDSL